METVSASPADSKWGFGSSIVVKQQNTWTNSRLDGDMVLIKRHCDVINMISHTDDMQAQRSSHTDDITTIYPVH